MFGKKPEEYLRFDRWILILIAVVFTARLGLSLAGAPIGTAKWVSINIVLLVGLIYCAVAVHTSGFGSYKQLFGLLLFQLASAHALIALAIILGIVTGSDNIFTAPEFFGGNDGKSWVHVLLHVVLPSLLLTPIYWLIGSGILFVTRMVRPRASA